jgi:hypothetical protein
LSVHAKDSTEISLRFYFILGITGFVSYWAFCIYWFITTKNDLGGPLLKWIAIIVFTSEAVLSIHDGKVKFFGWSGLGILLAWMTEVYFTFSFPNISPINHQLLPLEPIILMFVIVLSTLIGTLLGRSQLASRMGRG